MATERQATAGAPPLHAQLIQMGMGFWVSRILYAAAKLSLADHLAEGPKSAVELAGQIHIHAPSLHRLMPALCSAIRAMSCWTPRPFMSSARGPI